MDIEYKPAPQRTLKNELPLVEYVFHIEFWDRTPLQTNTYAYSFLSALNDVILRLDVNHETIMTIKHEYIRIKE